MISQSPAATYRTFIESILTKDAVPRYDLCADDVVFAPNQWSLHGRDALQAAMAENWKKWEKIDVQFLEEAEGQDETGYARLRVIGWTKAGDQTPSMSHTTHCVYKTKLVDGKRVVSASHETYTHEETGPDLSQR